MTKQKRVPAGRKLVDFYHANRSTEERASVQGAWMVGNTRILAATVAFGMGIDKPDVRWVFHHSMSKSLEGIAPILLQVTSDAPVAVMHMLACLVLFSNVACPCRVSSGVRQSWP